MGLFSGIGKEAGAAGAQIVGEVLDKGADIADRFIHTEEEKAAYQLEVQKLKIQETDQAIERDAAVYKDRQGAREMAGVHSKLQQVFALTFLVGFFLLIIGEFVFIGFIIKWVLDGGAPIPDWLQVLIASTLSGTIGYMSSMLKEVVGFLFGGSAGGDQNGAALAKVVEQTGANIAPSASK